MTDFVPTVDVNIYRGSTEQAIWAFYDADGNSLDLTGSEFELTIALKDDDASSPLIRKKTVDGDGLGVGTVEDDEGNTIPALIWSPTPTESRSIPRGAVAYAEIERRIAAAQEIWWHGRIKGIGGLNRDDA